MLLPALKDAKRHPLDSQGGELVAVQRRREVIASVCPQAAYLILSSLPLQSVGRPGRSPAFISKYMDIRPVSGALRWLMVDPYTIAIQTSVQLAISKRI